MPEEVVVKTEPRPPNKLLQDSAVFLGEFFDSVRIVATVHDQATGLTHTLTYGVGNVHAQLNACRSWVSKTEE